MLNATHIVQSGGLLLLGLFLFAEVGLFLGFFLPGDTLLIAAGIFAHQGHFPVEAVIVVAIVAAIAGDSTAFFIGRRYGRGLFKKQDSLLFDPKHVERAEKFYDKHGAKTMLIAHYLPVVRTFAPPLAGISNMTYPKFLLYDGIGDISWAVIITLIGYFIGSKIPNIDHYILFVVMLVVVASLAPTLYHITKRYLKQRKNKADQPNSKKD
jgi:membrane-associated protein